jgi:hypothetical protein
VVVCGHRVGKGTPIRAGGQQIKSRPSQSFTYTVSDGFPGTTTATVYITLWAEGLSSSVTALVQGGAALPADGKSLLTLLQSAANSSTAGNTTAAIGQLNAFIAQVGAFVKNGKLTAAQGESLISAAQAAIASMGN